MPYSFTILYYNTVLCKSIYFYIKIELLSEIKHNKIGKLKGIMYLSSNLVIKLQNETSKKGEKSFSHLFSF